ncbi:hypothetical protein AGMMS4956_14170 [Bacteroidia bacterium]|nr:hypothetical protein AGMMS4956_14170 [Bacteroidia bacterium]
MSNKNNGAKNQQGADDAKKGANLQQDADDVQKGAENQQGADGAGNGNENATTETKKSKSKFAEKAERIFKQYPVSNELHFTCDGTAFFNKIDAKNYANGLGNKDIETVTR